MKRDLIYSVVILVTCVMASGVFAQRVNPCDGDIARFCANIRPGGGAIAECLRQNEAQLSPDCKAQHLADVAEVLKQTDQECKSDVGKYCGSYWQEGGLPLLDCLRRFGPSLSPECNKKLFEALELMHY
jgi:hypothetical protein